MSTERVKQRELKFRVWNGAEMVYDVTVGRFGVFYVNPGGKGNGLDPYDSASITPFTTKYHEGTPVMQFTGLLDKSGKEIFEGDRVNCLSESGENSGEPDVIEFRNGCFYLRHRNYNVDNWTHYSSRDGDEFNGEFEVIGNIYSSPSSIEESKAPITR